MEDLISLTDYKNSQSISSTSDDTRLKILITSVSQLVKTYCANSINDYYFNNKVEEFNIDWATPSIQLTECPVNTIVSVQERTSYSAAYSTLTTGNFDYFLDSRTDSIFRTNSSGRKINWQLGVGAVKVTYTAGYSDVPEDLKLAVFDLITYYRKDEHKVRQTIAGASIQNSASSSQRGNVGFPDHIKRVLDLYKNF